MNPFRAAPPHAVSAPVDRTRRRRAVAVVVWTGLALGLGGCGGETAPSVATPSVADGGFTPPPSPEAAAQLASVQSKALAGCGPVTAEGFCGVKFGMAPAAARQAFPGRLDPLNEIDPADASGCQEIFSNAPIEGVSFLIKNNVIGRVDFLGDGPKTIDGFGVGAEAAALRAHYGAGLRSQPNKYEPDVADLILDAGSTRMIFEIQDGKVRAWRAGLPPVVDAAERCG